MIDKQIHRNLILKLHKENAFWSYDKSTIKNISDDILIANVLLHLDIEDVLRLFKLFPKRKIQRVWKDKILSQEPMYHGLNRLYAFLLFDIKNSDRYIQDFKRKRYKSLLCED